MQWGLGKLEQGDAFFFHSKECPPASPSIIFYYLLFIHHPRAEPESPALIFSSLLLFSNSPVTPGAWAEATPCNAGSALFQQLGIDPCKGGLAIYEVPRTQRGQLQTGDVDRTGDERCSSQTTGFLLFISVQGRGGGVLPELSEVLQEMGFACGRLNLEFISLLGSVPVILRSFVQLMFKQYSFCSL